MSGLTQSKRLASQCRLTKTVAFRQMVDTISEKQLQFKESFVNFDIITFRFELIGSAFCRSLVGQCGKIRISLLPCTIQLQNIFWINVPVVWGRSGRNKVEMFQSKSLNALGQRYQQSYLILWFFRCRFVWGFELLFSVVVNYKKK